LFSITAAPSGWKAPSDTAQPSSSCCQKSSSLGFPIHDYPFDPPCAFALSILAIRVYSRNSRLKS
jgi:hypothetical protein